MRRLHLVHAGFCFDGEGEAARGRANGPHLAGGDDAHAFALEDLEDELSELRVAAGQRLRHIENDDVGAQAAKGLGQLEAHGAGAQNEQTLRQKAGFEDRLAGEIRNLIKSIDRRNGGRGPRGNDKAARRDVRIPRRHGRGIDKTRFATDDRAAEVLESLLAVIGSNRVNGSLHLRHDSSEINMDLAGGNAELPGAADIMSAARRSDERFRRHAAVVETVTAHGGPLNQHDLAAKLRGGRGNGQAAGARTDDAEVAGDLVQGCLSGFHFAALRCLSKGGRRAKTPSSKKAASIGGVSKAKGSSAKLQGVDAAVTHRR
jgi:hypothetical protein